MKPIAINNRMIINDYKYVTLGSIIENGKLKNTYIAIKVTDTLNFYIRVIRNINPETGEYEDLTETNFKALIAEQMDKNIDIIELNNALLVSNDNTPDSNSMVSKTTVWPYYCWFYTMSYDNKLDIKVEPNKDHIHFMKKKADDVKDE